MEPPTTHGNEFQAKFNWHVEGQGIRHNRSMAKPDTFIELTRMCSINSFPTRDNCDLNEKLNEWEAFYNFHRPHGAFKGKTPYEFLKEN